MDKFSLISVQNERNEWKGLTNLPKPSVAESKDRWQRRRKPLNRTTSWKRTQENSQAASRTRTLLKQYSPETG